MTKILIAVIALFWSRFALGDFPVADINSKFIDDQTVEFFNRTFSRIWKETTSKDSLLQSTSSSASFVLYEETNIYESPKDCSGATQYVQGNRYSSCSYSNGVGTHKYCEVDDKNLNTTMYTETYSTSPQKSTCEGSPDAATATHYGCTVGTYANMHYTCLNGTVYDTGVTGLTIVEYDGTCTDSQLIAFGTMSKVCQPTGGAEFKIVTCDPKRMTVSESYYRDPSCVIPSTATKPMTMTVPPFGHCYDASHIWPNTNIKVVPLCLQ